MSIKTRSEFDLGVKITFSLIKFLFWMSNNSFEIFSRELSSLNYKVSWKRSSRTFSFYFKFVNMSSKKVSFSIKLNFLSCSFNNGMISGNFFSSKFFSNKIWKSLFKNLTSTLISSDKSIQWIPLPFSKIIL